MHNLIYNLVRWFPILRQAKTYSRATCASDVMAALIVTAMVIPQSLAYASLAGLPPHYGLYASILPVVIYSLLGTSSTLAIGPVAISSIMTAQALSSVVDAGLVSYMQGAVLLAFLSGAMLLSMGLLKLGFIAHLLSHSVVSGFITASCLIIALGQMQHVLGVDVSGSYFWALAVNVFESLNHLHLATALIGGATLLFLVLARTYAVAVFTFLGLSQSLATHLSRMFPIMAVLITTWIVAAFSLDVVGVAVVGEIPVGIADPQTPFFNLAAIKALCAPAFFIALIGYVGSISVGRTLAAKRNEKIDENQELVALGSANIAAGFVGAFPVAGGFSRSVINYNAGAKTQFAGIFTALGMAVAAVLLTPYLYYLPIAVLAATIIVAVMTFIDFSVFYEAWRFSKSDFVAVVMTVFMTLAAGVKVGVATGIAVSILLHLYRTSKPHIAEIGRVPNTHYFKNSKYYQVELIPNAVSLRIDESLIFSNVSYLESYIFDVSARHPHIQHIILHCGAINSIDLSGIHMLEELNKQLLTKNIQLHLSEIKTPVKKLLEKVGFISALGGQVYITHLQAHNALTHTQESTKLRG